MVNTDSGHHETTLIVGALSGGFDDRSLLEPPLLPVTGTYTFEVDPYDIVTGTATMSLYTIPADASASIVINGPAVPLTIPVPSQGGVLTFSATAGRVVTFRVTASTMSGSTQIQVKKPDGTVLFTGSARGRDLHHRAESGRSRDWHDDVDVDRAMRARLQEDVMPSHTRHWRVVALVVSQLCALASSARAQGAGDAIVYYDSDAIGSVRFVSNAAGQMVERHDYLPFGQEWPGDAGVSKRKFGGKEHDGETGFDYFGARFFSSAIGRFSTVDPNVDLERNVANPQRWNRYAYVTSNPLRYVDPDGRDGRSIVAAADAICFAGPAACAVAFAATATYLVYENHDAIVRSMTSLLGAATAAFNPAPPSETIAKASTGAEILRDLQGFPTGKSAPNRQASEPEIRDFFERHARGGQDVTSDNYPGKLVRLPDGTLIGLREGSRSGGVTVDVTVGTKSRKLHLPKE